MSRGDATEIALWTIGTYQASGTRRRCEVVSDGTTHGLIDPFPGFTHENPRASLRTQPSRQRSNAGLDTPATRSMHATGRSRIDAGQAGSRIRTSGGFDAAARCSCSVLLLGAAADSGDHSAVRWHSHERAHLLEIFRFEFKSKLVRVSLTVYPHH